MRGNLAIRMIESAKHCPATKLPFQRAARGVRFQLAIKDDDA